jgi:hypothetical protein
MPTSALFPVLGLLVVAGVVGVVRRVRLEGTGVPAGLTHDRPALTAGVLLALYPLVFGLADGNVLGAVPAAALFGSTAAVLVHRHRSKRSPSA